MLDQLFYSTKLQRASEMEMLLCIRDVVGQKTFDEGLIRQTLLPMLPQQAQAILISFRNSAGAFADQIIATTRTLR